MKYVRLFFAIILCMCFSGCVSNKYVLKTEVGNTENTGIVFGRITLQRFFGLGAYNADASFGTGLSFKNKETGEHFGVSGANYFVLQLPEGTYAVVSMGSPAGYLAPKDEPFRFSVEKGKIKYIGAIVGDRDLKRHFDEISKVRQPLKNDIKSYRIYGLGKYDKSLVGRPTGIAGEPFIDFFIIDEGQAAISKFIEEFPQYKDKAIVVDLMH
ncbi:MAG: hypothetical protein M1406_08920 [Nitrospirae bacterium]|nr:hypothetical protein [Nitrospirota bacterium]